VPSKVGPVDEQSCADCIQRFYTQGIYPDWWKLEAASSEIAWKATIETINRNDMRTRGIVVLGLDAPQQQLQDSFKLAARFPLVKGFAVGRTIFGDVARDWMQGSIDDEQAVNTMQSNYAALCDVWDEVRAPLNSD